MKEFDKEELIHELDNINLELTAEEKEELECAIQEREDKVNFMHKVRTHLTIIAVLFLIAIPMFSGLMIFAPIITAAALLSFSAYFRAKMVYHAHVLTGLKQPSEEVRDQFKHIIENM